MSQNTNNSKNRLGLNLFEANLKRHPSVKGLFDENGNMKIPTNSNDEYLLFNISNKDGTNDTLHYIGVAKNEEEHSDKENNDKKEVIPVQINRVEEKPVDNTTSFFTELDDKEKQQIIKNRDKYKTSKTNLSVPLSYEFNEEQKELDKHITEQMSKGKNFEEIESNLKYQTKNKK